MRHIIIVVLCLFAGTSLLSVFNAVRPSLNADQLTSSTERLLHALTSTGSLEHQQMLSEALMTLHYLDSSSGDAPTNHPTTLPFLSDPSLQQLLRANLSSSSEPLTHLTLCLVCRRLRVSSETVSVERWATAAWEQSDTQTLGCLLKKRVPACCALVDTCAPVSTRTEGKEEIDHLLAAVAGRIQAKGLAPPSLTRACQKLCSTHCGDVASWLPRELMTQLLDSAVEEPTVPRCALSACLLLHLPKESAEYFSCSCVPVLCGHGGGYCQSEGGVGVGGPRLKCVRFRRAVFVTVVEKQKEGTGNVREYVCLGLSYLLVLPFSLIPSLSPTSGSRPFTSPHSLHHLTAPSL